MRVVNSNSPVWRRGGVAGTDAAALVGCGLKDEENPLVLWATKLWVQERPMRKVYLKQGSAEWLKWRNAGIGGSEVAAVVGADYGNKLGPHGLWQKKTQQRGEEAENANMRRGKNLEPVARRLYEELFDWSVGDVCVIHDDYDFVRASLDGLRGDDKLLVEIKCCGDTNHGKLLGLQAVSDPLERQTLFARTFGYYRYQVLLQLAITGADVCHFVGYNEQFPDHRRLAVVELYPEPEEQKRLIERCVDFWGYVERREPPPFEFCLPAGQPPTSLRLP